MSKKPLVIINGPTAVGKTAVSVELALRIGGEIISADSMQVYRGMDIGTAKIKPEEMRSVPHHMIDIIEPDEPFSVLIFKDLAKKCIDEITGRGHIPILAGGTGFYIQAVLYDVDFTEYDDEKQGEVRKRLEKELERDGAEALFERLKEVDPVYAGIIHPNNTKRLLHSLEYYELTGKRISEHNEEQSVRESPYDFFYFVLTDDRVAVYDRINRRVDVMMEEGLEAEVRGLLERGYEPGSQSMLGIGYKEMTDYITGAVSYDEAVETIKRETRHFAKKQMTWFKREREVDFIDRRDYRDNNAITDELARRIRTRWNIPE